ncbi:hypothetical protein GCM10010260_04300 [Streptomyces filipinensis]|uniref:Uncharacterized protein n=1 Tax=Streptomyces filipinensis TaxID=66887 RepID=A0A918M7X2_9ACTN|nr:hypothetical protein GCM10010260_04300 [Streptomyces filipinensis]
MIPGLDEGLDQRFGPGKRTGEHLCFHRGPTEGVGSEYGANKIGTRHQGLTQGAVPGVVGFSGAGERLTDSFQHGGHGLDEMPVPQAPITPECLDRFGAQ